MKYLLILLFLVGCNNIKDAPELTAGQCYSNGPYSEYARLVVKKVQSKYPEYANAYIVVNYNRIDKNYYFRFQKKELFDPVTIEKCPFIEKISSDAVKRLKVYGLWEQFKTIVQGIKQ